ncbi:transposase [Hafnia paralvei]|uniref:Transposase n=1 Tax=Hafnia paralvei TaxID=546367 RepID=A0A4Q9ERX3_9GAMM|nr:transposase [Hafnia paralvei]TBM28331.1 transposase [Hafnia paralvei]
MNRKRKFTLGFKNEAVALVTKQDYTITRAATSLGIKFQNPAYMGNASA